jgi:HK97 family phage portal protein
MIAALLARLTGRTAERRALTASDFPGLPIGTASGQAVSTTTAENLAAVLACVNAISSAAGSMNPLVYRTIGGRRQEAPDHPVARLTRRPNDLQTWPDYAEWLLAQALLNGNAVSEIVTDGAGRVVSLVPIPSGNVTPVLLPSNRLALDVVAWQGPFGGTGRSRRLMPGEFLHLKDRSDDGLVGRSRLSRAREVIGTAQALQEWSGSMWANQMTPAGAIKLPGRLDDAGMTRLRSGMRDSFSGPHNARKMLILPDGAEWQSLSVSPEDAEVLASRRFTVEELCRLFQVPPPIVQDLSHGTFTNSREAGRWFAQFTLAPWVRKIEAEFARSVFTDPSMSLELDMSALMRGDAETRWQSHKIAVEAGILDADEVREIEGFNPRGQREVVA